MAHIRYRIHARSIRAGILVARGIQSEPGGMIDWDLFLRAYLRTKDAAGLGEGVGGRADEQSAGASERLARDQRSLGAGGR